MRLKKNEKVVWACAASLVGAAVAYGFLIFAGVGEVFKSYFLVGVLGILLSVVLGTLGYRKSKDFLQASALRLVVTNCLLFGILVYALGLILGFTRGYFSFAPEPFFSVFLPVALYAVFAELLRYLIKIGSPENRKGYFTVSSALLALAVLTVFELRHFAGAEQIFVWFWGAVAPLIATEMLCTFLCLRFDLRPALLFKCLFLLYPFLLPLIPDLGNYLHAVFWLLLTFAIYVSCSRLYATFDRDLSHFRRFRIGALAVPLIIFAVLLTALVSGVFGYRMIAIASDSMRPVYERGDAVIFEKVPPSQVQKGEVLVFRRGSVIVTHRVVKITDDHGRRGFVTKGDANKLPDDGVVLESEVLGCVRLYTKYIGFPTLWLSEVFNRK